MVGPLNPPFPRVAGGCGRLGRWLICWIGGGRRPGAPVRGPDPASTRAGEQLLARWREPHRHYHTVAHLTAVLDVVDQHADLAGRPDVVRLAAWFHDAVYDPRAAGDANERDSAALAESVLTGLGVPAPTVAEVRRLVLLTAGHTVAPGDPDGALLCDADLAVLAAPPADYDRYAAAIRAGVRARAGAGLPGRAGRRVDRPAGAARAVPAAAAGRARWEEPARDNVRRELAALSGGRRTRADQVLRATQSRGAEQPDQLPARHHLGTEPHRRREPVGRNVVVVPVEAASGRAERLGEGVQLGVRDVADQVRPEPTAPRPGRPVQVEHGAQAIPLSRSC